MFVALNTKAQKSLKNLFGFEYNFTLKKNILFYK